MELRRTDTGDLLGAAISYANRGWRVFPIRRPDGERCTCSTPGCNSAGRHSHIKAWSHAATTDESKILRWWTKWPDANVGILTGNRSGLLVLDVDNKNEKDGRAALSELQRKYDWKPATFTVKTSSGEHLYFQHPGGDIPGGTCALGPGLDLQSDGRCVIAPPSLHRSGAIYTIVDPHAALESFPAFLLAMIRDRDMPTSDAPVLILPPDMIGAATEKRDNDESSSSSTVPYVSLLATDIPVGQRNDRLTRVAGVERHYGATEEEMVEVLARENQQFKEPVSYQELRGIARSVARYDSGRPNLYWMPFVIAEWDSSLIVKSGTSSERGMYMSLLVEVWRHGGTLPDNGRLWRLASADDEQQFEHSRDFLLSEFESRNMGGNKRVLAHLRLERLWHEQAEKYSQKVEAGRKSSKQRRGKKEEQASP